jgi:competence ComEA-like helix-hairpin-helix protein
MATRTRQRIDINSASADEIERACGIDGVLAKRIVAYRDEHGPFKSREDLDAVPAFAEVRTDEVLSMIDLPARGQTRRRSGQPSTRKTSASEIHSARESGESTQRGRTSRRSNSSAQATSRSRSSEAHPPSRKAQRSGESESHRTSRSAEPTTDHDFIKRWVEERGGWPARVKGTGRRKGDPGMIRIDFPDFSGRESLERIDWDEWFRQFDENGLAFLYREMRHSGGDLDRFNKLVRRDDSRG